ncbi:RNA polymerase sigma factor RpoD [Lachnoclostridium phytofermentans]|uniref:RNA polymerase sigma-70 domain-containing protein n=1 Tax=Lachnoclostridium phytofermentans (strain ATCC 700394 / DSM 18823 / ISDg) TaxID=357809 RepID=A9KIH5_LACP7|nr:hypothetical protein [Lachnoclostridium phytofermentans]ABX42427.1 hypothetical protein Cphy_2059 [Lachnoclostridium phytofermentans ISDg]
MIDKIQFLETLRSLTEIAKVSENPLSKEEILSHFDGMTLTKEQQEMVYQYLLTPVEEREKEDMSEEDSTPVEDELSKENKEKNSVFLEMYLEDIKHLPRLTAELEERAYIRLINGDNSVSQSISDHWLSTVVELAKKYETYDVNMEDLIQEGNIGLLGGLKQLLGSNQKIEAKEYLMESVLKAFENYIDEVIDEDDMENSILSKITLINEAITAFAEDNGVTPTVMEIADYTKISEDEIASILRLSLDTVKEKE